MWFYGVWTVSVKFDELTKLRIVRTRICFISISEHEVKDYFRHRKCRAKVQQLDRRIYSRLPGKWYGFFDPRNCVSLVIGKNVVADQ